MVIDFVPQFHKKIAQSDGRRAWVAMPLPKTLIPAKTGYYRAWQHKESQRLRDAGEHVIAVASPRSTAEAERGRIVRRGQHGFSTRAYR